MTEAKDIPPGTYSLELGSTFTEQRKNDVPAYHTLRCAFISSEISDWDNDFKPMSVASSESDTYIAFGGNGDVHLTRQTRPIIARKTTSVLNLNPNINNND
uniref:Uncharacterized protein n=1 Tax=Heterorhabditis bacteriophora TaxID=37862 RepID=A0A1I7WXW8_HETBA